MTKVLSIRANEPTTAVVRLLLRQQFSHWADLPITPVRHQGVDNRTFKLGSNLSVRLPSADRYAPQVDKEHRWLSVLAPHLPVSIPIPVARGEPCEDFPRPWSVYQWLPGQTLAETPPSDLEHLAVDLADFLRALHRAPTDGAPAAGEHNFFRGAAFEVYAEETLRAASRLQHPVHEITSAWVAEAVTVPYLGESQWVHGDISAGNLLVNGDHLAAVIDFGCSAVGDPACDLVPAWTIFTGNSRRLFISHLGLDTSTWVRARAWALWKAAITINDPDACPGTATLAQRTLDELLQSVDDC